MKVLIVEDELLIQKSLKKLIEKRGVEVAVESAGRNAIETIKTNDFDRIICDLMLQDITGFDVIEESKFRYSTEQIGKKFVIMTAYSSSQVLEKASQYGCQVLSKPFDDIQKAIDIFLDI